MSLVSVIHPADVEEFTLRLRPLGTVDVTKEQLPASQPLEHVRKATNLLDMLRRQTNR